MLCPACNNSFEKKRLASHLMGRLCTQCQAVSFTLADYLHFLERTKYIESEPEQDEVMLEMAPESRQALVCGCGTIMSKYRINNTSERRVDYCSTCQTVCLDGGEWEFLLANGMQRHINKLFAASYQRKLRLENTSRVLDEKFERQFGASDYARIKDVREWLINHAERDALMAYLNAKDPYSTGN